MSELIERLKATQRYIKSLPHKTWEADIPNIADAITHIEQLEAELSARPEVSRETSHGQWQAISEKDNIIKVVNAECEVE